MQAAPIALNGRKYLPKILDYEFFTRQPRTSEITNKILQFYGGSFGFAGINIDYISDVGLADKYRKVSIILFLH
jgi:hypothetical protein